MVAGRRFALTPALSSRGRGGLAKEGVEGAGVGEVVEGFAPDPGAGHKVGDGAIGAVGVALGDDGFGDVGADGLDVEQAKQQGLVVDDGPGMAAVNVRIQDANIMMAGVFLERLKVVEAHGLFVKEPYIKL